MVQKHRDIRGEVFGNLTAIEKVGSDKKGYAVWRCSCACGKETVVRSSHLWCGNTKSCGCSMVKAFTSINYKHGLSKHPLYVVWRGMKSRCYNVKHENYRNYGGRGIDVCVLWLNDFKNFYDWSTSNGWEKGLEIDRINNYKGYSPDNCRYVTPEENRKNKRK